MDLSRTLDVLGIKNLEKTCLAELEDRVDRNVGSVLSRQNILDTYLGWLSKQLVQNMFFQQQFLVERWIKSLRFRGFDKEHIYQSFKEWQQHETSYNPSNLRRFLMAEQELCNILDNTVPRDHIDMLEVQDHLVALQEDQPPGLGKDKNKRRESSTKEQAESRDYRVGKQRTGANDIPITNCRGLGPSLKKERMIDINPESSTENRIRSNCPIPCHLRTPSDVGSPMDPGDLMIVREQILLDLPSRKDSVDSPTGDTPRQSIDYRGDYISAVKSGVLENMPPGMEYICKRCNKKGHWLHLCPTNLDPSFDVPPNKDYRCNYCHRVGHHFATLCPNNHQEWSLTHQRRRTDRSVSSERSHEHSRSPPGDRHLYRSRDAPQSSYAAADKFRPEYPDDHSRSPERKKSQDRPGKRTRGRRTSRRQLEKKLKRKRANKHTRRQERNGPADHEGRLFYEEHDDDGDYITINDVPNVGKIKTKSPQQITTEQNSREQSLEHIDKVAVEADDFLHSLGEQIRDDFVELTCSQTLDTIMNEVCGEENLMVFQDADGVLCKKVTNPPFHDEVVRLFTNHLNPVIHPRAKRPLALRLWEHAVERSIGAQCPGN